MLSRVPIGGARNESIFMPEQTTLAPHLFTHTGDEVLILKCVAKDGTSYKVFHQSSYCVANPNHSQTFKTRLLK